MCVCVCVYVCVYVRIRNTDLNSKLCQQNYITSVRFVHHDMTNDTPAFNRQEFTSSLQQLIESVVFLV